MSDLIQETLDYRAELEAGLTKPFGWLSLAGLFWLDEGVNRCGTDPGYEIALPEGSGPMHMADFTRQGNAVSVSLADGVEGTLNDQPVRTASMESDHSETPDFLIVGDLRFLIIERGGQLALRVWWAQHPNRLNFGGREWYAVDPHFRLTARIERYDPPREVLIDDMLGNQNDSVMHARLLMALDGRDVALDAQQIPDGRYYMVFKDATAGKTTYPAARFLYSEPPDGDQVVVDFNKAYSPPCAFTAFATCPLPIPENILPVEIAAGERYGGMPGH
jgi:hypothetical protein